MQEIAIQDACSIWRIADCEKWLANDNASSYRQHPEFFPTLQAMAQTGAEK